MIRYFIYSYNSAALKLAVEKHHRKSKYVVRQYPERDCTTLMDVTLFESATRRRCIEWLKSYHPSKPNEMKGALGWTEVNHKPTCSYDEAGRYRYY